MYYCQYGKLWVEVADGPPSHILRSSRKRRQGAEETQVVKYTCSEYPDRYIASRTDSAAHPSADSPIRLYDLWYGVGYGHCSDVLVFVSDVPS